MLDGGWYPAILSLSRYTPIIKTQLPGIQYGRSATAVPPILSNLVLPFYSRELTWYFEFTPLLYSDSAPPKKKKEFQDTNARKLGFGFPPTRPSSSQYLDNHSACRALHSTHMLLIDQAHWLATQEIIIHVRRQPSGPRRGRAGRKSSLAPIGPGDSRPATLDTHNKLLPLVERLGARGGSSLALDVDEHGHEWSESEGPILATPMGVVRPWYGAGPHDGDEDLLLESRQRAVRDSKMNCGSRRGETSIIETPMGIVRPTGVWQRLERDRKIGDGDITIVHGEPLARNEEGRPSSDSKRLTGSPTDGSWQDGPDEKMGEGPNTQTLLGNMKPPIPRAKVSDDGTNSPEMAPVETGEEESGLREEPLPMKRRTKHNPPADGIVSAAFKDIVDQYLSTNRKLPRTPRPTETGPHDLLSPTPERPQPITATTTDPNALRNITTLTLLTEDLQGLTAFYIHVLGATLASSTTFSATLALTPQLSARLLHSSFARDRAIFGDDVVVGHQAAMPKRVLLGVEVRDVDAVWRRLRDWGHGAEESDGQEMLGEVRAVGGRRSVCFVDLAGHCWEAWQTVGRRVQGGGL